MLSHEDYMHRCLALAAARLGHVAPNPMVGCVIVRGGDIIGEGAHEVYGGPHAEVNAIRNAGDDALLQDATLYVNLEPCAHFGKTPPCADLIISKKIPRVIIGCLDSNPLVAGKGVAKLRAAGIEVFTGVLEKECRELNRRFFTFFEKKRPYIILKWAESSDGFIDHDRTVHGNTPAQISSYAMQVRSHEWRTQESAIMVGTNTALADDPQLTARHAQGPQPLRLLIDRTGKVKPGARLLNGSTPTLVFTEQQQDPAHVEFIRIDFSKNILQQIFDVLYERRIQSVIVEGGAQLLRSFLDSGSWDEIRRIVSPPVLGSGVKAPELQLNALREESVGPDRLLIYRNA